MVDTQVLRYLLVFFIYERKLKAYTGIGRRKRPLFGRPSTARKLNASVAELVYAHV